MSGACLTYSTAVSCSHTVACRLIWPHTSTPIYVLVGDDHLTVSCLAHTNTPPPPHPLHLPPLDSDALPQALSVQDRRWLLIINALFITLSCHILHSLSRLQRPNSRHLTFYIFHDPPNLHPSLFDENSTRLFYFPAFYSHGSDCTHACSEHCHCPLISRDTEVEPGDLEDEVLDPASSICWL